MHTETVETTDGVLILPRKVSWGIAVAAVAWMLGGAWMIFGMQAGLASVSEDVTDMKADATASRAVIHQRLDGIDQRRQEDRESMVRVEEQLKYLAVTLGEVRDLLKPTAGRR